MEGELSESFATIVGVRQGCIVASCLFNIFLDGCMRKMLVQGGVSGVANNFIVACLQMTLYSLSRVNGNFRGQWMNLLVCLKLTVRLKYLKK